LANSDRRSTDLGTRCNAIVANRGSHPIAADHKSEWQVFLENRDAVIEALKRGECDGILPAARGFLDGFAGFLLDAGICMLEQFADSRQRRSIPIFFFCHTLIYRPLFRLARLAAIEQTLFRSPYILRQLGSMPGRSSTASTTRPDSQRPFTVEAIPECFAGSQASDFLVISSRSCEVGRYCPGELRSQLWVMDSVYISVPAGAHTPGLHFKVCVLGIWQDQVVWPLLWAFVPAEHTICQQLSAWSEQPKRSWARASCAICCWTAAFLDGACSATCTIMAHG